MKKIIRFLNLRTFLERFLLVIICILAILLPVLIFPEKISGEAWLKVDEPEGDTVWVDTSHWETKEIYISDGYYRDIKKKRWIDTSYMENQGYWATGTYRVWVEEKQVVAYTAYRYIDTSHWETRYTYAEVIRPVSFTVIHGTDPYGWSVYAFAAKPQGMQQVYYYGTKYLAQKWVIDYRPYRGGRIYAVKYVFMYKFVTERRPYSVWISSGYWQPYTAYRVIDTSHWETRTGRYWVDTSYLVESGYWEEYSEKEWVETGHTEYRDVWVEDGYYTEPLHGKIKVEKNPRYVFTRWHKDSDGDECGMDLLVSWEVYGTAHDGETTESYNRDIPEITRVNIFEEVHRYDDKGIDRVVVFDGDVNPEARGSLETFTKFEHAGSKESILHIYLCGDNNQVVHAYFSNPINGFRSINIDYDGTDADAQDWLGGNHTGEVEF
jgi:hypothetical protein